ncbi:MAG: calcineurin, partial [Myxococcales bacterium]|nr:calcineurin [Myxococcales bacterium]
HVTYGLDRLNAETSAWMRGAGASPELLHLPDSPVWTRVYSAPGKEPACAVLDEALAAMGAKRMVVGHTVHTEGIQSACDDRIWMIDVGLAKYYQGPTQVLEIRGDAVTVLKG